MAAIRVMGVRRPILPLARVSYDFGPPAASEQPAQGPAWYSWITKRLGPRQYLMLAIAAAFFTLYLFAYPRSLDEPTFNSPRENVGYVLSEQFASNFRFEYPLQHYEELPTDIARALTPRDAAEIEGSVVPKDFAGTMLLHAPFFLVWKPLVLAITPLFAILGAFVLARISEELFDWRVGLLAFVAWLAYPPLFINASYIFTSDTVALYGSLLAMLCFLRYWREGGVASFVVMCAALGLSVLMRYPNLILAGLLALALFEGRRYRRPDTIYGVAAFLPFAVATLVFNKLVYGGFTVTGFHLGAELVQETANFSEESFLKIRPEVMVGYLRSYALEWPIMLVPQLAGIGVAAYVAWRRAEIRVPIAVLVGSGAVLAIYYLPQDAWGWTNPQVNASVLRYLLPSLAIWTVFLSYGVLRLTAGREYIAVIAVAALVGGYGWTAWSGPAGVQEAYQVTDQISELRDDIVATTESDAIIATRIMDKVLFPERQTVTMTYLLNGEEPLDKGRNHTWQFLPEEDRFAEVAVRVYEEDIPMYVLADYDWRIAKDYDEALRPLGYRLRHMRTAYPQFEDIGFYKVVPLESVQAP